MPSVWEAAAGFLPGFGALGSGVLWVFWGLRKVLTYWGKIVRVLWVFLGA